MRLILHLANLFLRGTALMLGLVAAVMGLACLGGAFSVKLDALTHVAPVWLVLGLAGMTLACIFARDGERRAVMGLAAVGVLSTAVLIVPEVLSALHRPAKPIPGQTVKLIQFNVWGENNNPKATADWILAQNADVVMIEEGGGSAFPIVRALGKAYPNHLTCRDRHGCDTWIFSRWPLLAHRSFTEDKLPLFGAWATLDHPKGPFTVAATHFIWPFPGGPQQAQSRLLVKTLSPFPKDSLILTGDFNSTPWSWSLRRQDKALGLKRRTRALASWPSGEFSRVASAPFPILPIDHVYAGKVWKTVKVERGPKLGSDHRAVVITLTR
ncbi:MAG: endonuclease/exonuclease/phosphatase family protein [Caulobacter sp.]|nr:endonuclease/exonuclease/phosphatase family protein [Caulobacter sp.]